MPAQATWVELLVSIYHGALQAYDRYIRSYHECVNKTRFTRKRKRLPIEQIHCAVGVYFCGEDDSPEPARSTIRPQSDVSARDRASLPKQVLEILPLAVKGKLLRYVVSGPP